MIDGAPSFLFVPVSGAFGMGEYARSLAIARGAAARWPTASIRFVLSREAPYAASAPYPAILLASSPTFHTAAVNRVIAEGRPDVVIFDNAGRTAQLRAAKQAGARVVYISARRRQRRKAFRLRWMRLIDEHWIAYPEFIAGSFSAVERLKLRLFERPRVRFLDVILSSLRAVPHDSILARLGIAAGRYVLVVPGGGTGHPGAGDAVEQFERAAGHLAARGVDTIFVGGVPSEVVAKGTDTPFLEAAAGEVMAKALDKPSVGHAAGEVVAKVTDTLFVGVAAGEGAAAELDTTVGGRAAGEGAAAELDTNVVGRAAGEGAAAELDKIVGGRAAVERAATRVDTLPAGPAAGDASSGAAVPGVATPGAAGSRAEHLWMTGSLPQAELAELMRGARLVIANGGSTLLQSIACGKPCIGVPIAGDQHERIRRCVDAGVTVAAALDAAEISTAAGGLLDDESKLEALAGRALALGLADGIDVAVNAIDALLAAKSRS